MELSRISDSFDSLLPMMFSPARLYVPAVGRSRQPMMFISVVLPEPDGPMIATYSPVSTDSEMSLSTGTSILPCR